VRTHVNAPCMATPLTDRYLDRVEFKGGGKAENGREKRQGNEGSGGTGRVGINS